MARKIPVWQPPAAAVAAMQASGVSGNAYNGLGETQARRPKPFFWHHPSQMPFGEMQGYTLDIMYGQEDAGPIWDAFAMDRSAPGEFLQRGPAPNTVAQARIEKSPQDWSAAVKAFALDHHADDVGIAALDPLWVFEGYDVDFPWIISIAVAHDYEEIREAPSLPGNNRAIVEVGRQYTRGATAANHLRNFIREQGYRAESYEGPMGSAIAMIPAAIAGGLGELGKHHSIIHRKFGSSLRLAAVGTDMPLLPDAPDVLGADDFCSACQVCTDNCPPGAISDAKQMVRGVEKWYVDFEKCMPYFAEARGCTLCLAVCPWSRPGVADGLVVKMAKRRAQSA